MADTKIKDMTLRTFAAGDALEIDNGTTDNRGELSQAAADLLNATTLDAQRALLGAGLSYGGITGTQDGVNNTFTLPVTPIGDVILTRNGAVIDKSTFSVTGATLTFTAGLPLPQDTIRYICGTVVAASGGGGAVDSVNGQTGVVVLTATDVSAIPSAQKAAANGVASLDAGTKLPIAQLPTINSTNIADTTALGRSLMTAATAAEARADINAEASYVTVTTFVEEFCGGTPFVDGMTTSTTGGASGVVIRPRDAKTVGILDIRSNTTAGANVLGRVAAASIGGGPITLDPTSGVTHFFGFRVAPSSVPGTPTTDDSRWSVGTSDSGAALGSNNVEFAATNGGNWIATIINAGVSGTFDTGLPAQLVRAATTQTSTTVLVADTSGFEIGQPVAGAGIPVGTLITAIVPNTSITLSSAATASASITLYVGIWRNLSWYYNPTTQRVEFYHNLTLLGELGPGSVTPGTNVTQAVPTSQMFQRMTAHRIANTTSDFRMMLDTYIHRILRSTANWPTF